MAFPGVFLIFRPLAGTYSKNSRLSAKITLKCYITLHCNANQNRNNLFLANITKLHVKLLQKRFCYHLHYPKQSQNCTLITSFSPLNSGSPYNIVFDWCWENCWPHPTNHWEWVENENELSIVYMYKVMKATESNYLWDFSSEIWSKLKSWDIQTINR